MRRLVNPSPAEGSIAVRRASAKLNGDSVGVINDMPKCAGHPECLDRRPCSEDSKIRGYGFCHGLKTGGSKRSGNQIKHLPSQTFPCSSVSAAYMVVLAWLLQGFEETNCLELA